jgi:gamma-glutamyl:cysteine ligase YbdK (ATP-grasp superfamily)
MPARRVVHGLIDRLQDRAKELNCLQQLNLVREMADQPTGAVQQLKLYKETNDLAEVVRQMLPLCEITPDASSGQ